MAAERAPFEHLPVLPDEAINALNIRQGGIYVDGTLGGGGHSGLILAANPGRLIGIDRDEAALAAATSRLQQPNFQAARGNFCDMPEILQGFGIAKVDGILLDLGVSSHQLDTPQRGFSYRFDGPLDMRMDNRASLTAYEIVNHFQEKEIADILYNYGEERRSRQLAAAISVGRKIRPIETTAQLAEIIEKASPRRKFGDPHPSMRSFMALRIAVNNELDPLYNSLEQIIGNCLATGGRIAVITFHSLEDRIVKNLFQKLTNPCICPRDIPYCVCNKAPLVKKITKKPILPSQAELETNNRAHSAKLRVAERI